MLNTSGQSGHPSLCKSQQTFGFLPPTYVGCYFAMIFIVLTFVHTIYWLRIFIIKGYCILQNTLSTSIVIFCPYQFVKCFSICVSECGCVCMYVHRDVEAREQPGLLFLRCPPTHYLFVCFCSSSGLLTVPELAKCPRLDSQ